MKITSEELQKLILKTVPSILRDVAVESPNVRRHELRGFLCSMKWKLIYLSGELERCWRSGEIEGGFKVEHRETN